MFTVLCLQAQQTDEVARALGVNANLLQRLRRELRQGQVNVLFRPWEPIECLTSRYLFDRARFLNCDGSLEESAGTVRHCFDEIDLKRTVKCAQSFHWTTFGKVAVCAQFSELAKGQSNQSTA